MNLGTLADLITRKIGRTDDESVAVCKEFLRQRHEMIHAAHLWKDTVDTVTVSVAAEQKHVILPLSVARPLACWNSTSGMPMRVSSLIATIITNPGLLDSIGGFHQFAEVSSVGFPNEQVAVNRVGFTGGDDGAVVNVTGTAIFTIGANVVYSDHSESVTLNGSYITTSAAWSSISQMNKERTSLPIRVEWAGSFTWPGESTDAVFARVRMLDAFDSAVTLGFLVKKKLRQMHLDTDRPMIRDIDNALLALAQGDMLERDRQYAKSAAKIQEGITMMKLAISQEVEQAAYENRIIPECYIEDGQEGW